MVRFEGEHQISVEHEESASSAKNEAIKKIPGRNAFRLILLSFGLLCILQVALNISLRLTFWPNSFKEPFATFCPSVYYISYGTKTWWDSRRYCQERGADLVIVNSREEQNILRRFRQRLWIGLTDAREEGVWEWVDGTQLNTSYWRPGEPNSIKGLEDCGEIGSSGSENNWNDISCNFKNYWICERKLQ
ncbi:C-type lectin domain family 4 member M-like [Fundulus heteroclitus]|uniref:C-type lectin domain family 4 member M-like n=1 Tax=Fundulus heteroclitus TaxID=8078 RepID=UPI00165B817F|nr:C-type lectin domain family 4 member M-like [Fundulus heteroclitus]